MALPPGPDGAAAPGGPAEFCMAARKALTVPGVGSAAVRARTSTAAGRGTAASARYASPLHPRRERTPRPRRRTKTAARTRRRARIELPSTRALPGPTASNPGPPAASGGSPKDCTTCRPCQRHTKFSLGELKSSGASPRPDGSLSIGLPSLPLPRPPLGLRGPCPSPRPRFSSPPLSPTPRRPARVRPTCPD